MKNTNAHKDLFQFATDKQRAKLARMEDAIVAREIRALGSELRAAPPESMDGIAGVLLTLDNLLQADGALVAMVDRYVPDYGEHEGKYLVRKWLTVDEFAAEPAEVEGRRVAACMMTGDTYADPMPSAHAREMVALRDAHAREMEAKAEAEAIMAATIAQEEAIAEAEARAQEAVAAE